MIPEGTGMFIHRVHQQGTAEQIVAKAKTHGIDYLCVKFADGSADHAKGYPSYLPPVKKLVEVAHEQGIKVWGWPYIYGNDPTKEAKTEAVWFTTLGLDGFIIDAEAEYKYQPAKAVEYMKALREVLPDASIGLTSYMWPNYHGEFPWDEFMDGCDFIMPQAYWWGRGPVNTLATTMRENERFGKPIIPIGVTCEANGKPLKDVGQISRFHAAAGENVAYWYWDCTGKAAWEELKKVTGGTVTVEANGNRVAEIAKEVAGKRGKITRYVTVNGIKFDTHVPDWCSRFVRRCHEAHLMEIVPGYVGFDSGNQDMAYEYLPWLRRYASQANAVLLKGGKGKLGEFGPVSEPRPGDIVCFKGGPPGHIGIYLGSGMFAEGTSSKVRGPGTVVSSIADNELWDRISGFARVFNNVAQPAHDDLMLVGEDGPVDCDIQHGTGGVTADLMKLVGAFQLDLNIAIQLSGYDHAFEGFLDSWTVRVNVRPVLEGCGYKVAYKKHDDGRERVYCRRIED